MTYKILLVIGFLMIMFGWGACGSHTKTKTNADNHSHSYRRDSLDSVQYLQEAIQSDTNNQTGKIPENNK